MPSHVMPPPRSRWSHDMPSRVARADTSCDQPESTPASAHATRALRPRRAPHARTPCPASKEDGAFVPRGRYPLTAPAVIPLTSRRCTIRKNTTTGIENSTDAAISPPKSVPLFVENPASHTGSVYIPWSFSIT